MKNALPVYAELHCLSNFSFQRGASHPQELVARAKALGYDALALTDECSVAGVVRAHAEARRQGLKFIPGSEFALEDGRLVALPRDAQGWGNLCEFITAARRSAAKGEYRVGWDVSDFSLLQGCEVLFVPARGMPAQALRERLHWLRREWGASVWLAVELLHELDDMLWLPRMQEASRLSGVPLVAAGDVHMHVRSRKPLQDVVTAVGLGRPLAECGFALQPNAERHLRARARLAEIYPAGLLRRTLEVAQRCRFSLEELRYQYPTETVPGGLTPAQALRRFTEEGLQRRYVNGTPPDVRQQVEHELALIGELRYEMYFLTVHDIVRFAREQGILCQGRGSAANSAVCFALGVTEVDPRRTRLLFERFISRERREPPDIDVDFEHERREEVIQYIYGKYGRERAAIAAVVISYRPRSAIRDAGKVLGIDAALIDRFAREHYWFDNPDAIGERLAEAGLDPHDGVIHQWLEISAQLVGFPRHLSQHVGGFVLTEGPLTRLVPVENAAMDNRSIIQWDKDDLDAVGLLKVDVLALGMLSAIRRCLEFVSCRRGAPWRMQDIAEGDGPTYDMICAADTVGVFQIESRAQMSMLPRLRPRCYYDLVIEVAIVRPGPIQGGMVHPYLRRRQGLEENDCHPELQDALGRTLGVPLFQEQVMQIAMQAACFSPDEADDLRRSMAAWRRKGGVHKFHDRLVNTMVERGYAREFAERIFQQMLGFGDYGFPESHAASFALLVYVSSWLKRHEPACFLAAMLNAQPLGFYSPSQLVQDARRHGVAVRAVDATRSEWDCTLEDLPEHHDPARAPAVRLGLRLVHGLSRAGAQRIVQARAQGPFADVQDLLRRAALDVRDARALAGADALMALAGHRRQQAWETATLKAAPPLLRHAPVHEAPLPLPAPPEAQDIVFDYAATGLTLRRHPVALLREQLAGMRLLSAAQLRDLPSGRLVRACGIVTMRQQPQTAKGVVFVTLEDETGSVNVIVWKSLRQRQRAQLLHSRLLAVHGTWQRDEDSGGEVRHLVAGHLRDLTPLLGRLATASRDFH